ncbi:hypothetical protein NKH77_50525 [Streptomyces sp. M19]
MIALLPLLDLPKVTGEAVGARWRSGFRTCGSVPCSGSASGTCSPWTSTTTARTR